MTKPTDKKIGDMGFLAHLIELRDRLLRLVLVIGVIFIVLFPFAQDLYQWLAAPVLNHAQSNGMISTGPIAPVFVPYKVALLTAFLVALPYVFYQLWSFVAPGLYKHEKRLIVPLLSSSVFLFYLGIAFAYFLLLPMIFKVVAVMTPAGVTAMPDISEYLDFVMMIFIAFGFGFEMPIATILIISTGMISAKDLGKKRPYIVVGAFIVGMLLTPPDIISQIMLAIPMWLLFEIGLFASRFFKSELKQARHAKDKMDGYDDDEIEKRNISSKVAAGSAAATTAAVAPMWEDDDYTYDDDDDVNLDGDDDDDKKEPEHIHDSEEDFNFDDEDFKEMTDEEFDAEFDRIDAEEKQEIAQEEEALRQAAEAAKLEEEQSKKDKDS
ncbi:MAG: twin-arginine translocase subunit TatC [Thiotrichaceae bacterium]|nr:twin-arginine translocase subunit TatC [Thiotrichaceae bacterium]